MSLIEITDCLFAESIIEENKRENMYFISYFRDCQTNLRGLLKSV